ncbi:MAG: glycosyltransferase family 39 protein [Gammaproteobacteria bacterium]|nr:glycosyltransferase family 39 protein [Gammaproteobacteria bacterium]
MITAFNAHLSTSDKVLVGLFLALKLAILLVLPLTGDEAYFIGWGQQAELGYYDHPPVVGWLIYMLSFISEHFYFYRLFAFASTVFVSWLMYRLLEPSKGSHIAVMVAAIFLVSPLSLFAVLLANDTVLLIFGFLGFYYFAKALDEGSLVFAALAGVCLGLTFLSKYLAVPLFVGMIFYLVFDRRPGMWKLVLVAMTIASLFVLENIYFNLNNCWNNILFNLVARTKAGGFNPGYLALYFVTLLFTVPPQGLFRLGKLYPQNLSPLIKQAVYIILSFLIIFLLVSSFKRIGLHWLYLPVVFIYLLFCLLPVERLSSLLKYNAILSISIGMTLLLVITQIDELFADNKKYRDALVYTQTESICQALTAGETIYTLSYSQNSVLAYHCKNNSFHVFANTSKYGREGDKHINYRELDGSTMNILLPAIEHRKKVEAYFSSAEITPIHMTASIDYYLLEGKAFSFARYRPVIDEIVRLFYSPPAWLPAASCNFTQKYAL